MESSLFEDLLCFLQKEELVLKALRATNLKACLRTGTGTKGYEANAERAKYYRIYNKIEKSATADQKATLIDWERRLCSEAEDIDLLYCWTVKCGVWTVKCEVWSVKCEVRSVKLGV